MLEKFLGLFSTAKRADIISQDICEVEELRNVSFQFNDPDELDDELNKNPIEFKDLDALGYAEGQTFGIVYEDSKGNQTERYITVWDIQRSNDSLLLVGKCNLRKRTRSFRVDRIVEVYDVDGEIFEPIEFLQETFGLNSSDLDGYEGSQFSSFNKMRVHLLPEASLFAALALADGHFCNDEIEIGVRSLNQFIEKAGGLLDAQGIKSLERYFKRLRPSENEIELALHRLENLPPERKVRFLKDAKKVVMADGKVHDAEAQLLSEFSEELLGVDVFEKGRN